MNDAYRKSYKNVTTDYIVKEESKTRVEEQANSPLKSKLLMGTSSEDSKGNNKIKEISNSSSDRNMLSNS